MTTKTNKTIITLKVSEARPKDVGRAIARIDPEGMARIGVEVGDIVLIKGKRETPAKIMPAFSEDRGKGIVQIDGLVRENAKIGLDEKVSIYKTDSQPAQKITLIPLTLSRIIGRDRDSRYIGTLLDGLPMVNGDRIRANLFGTRSCDFTVADTEPKGIVVINAGTVVKMEVEEEKEARPRSEKISYEDIGGLKSQIQRIREMIELPLKYPQVFEKLGIDAPKGVFLHGPPGCGKTLIARAVANETEAYFTNISGPEIMGKFYGESEGRLRSVFEDAQAHAPAIVFIDEIDAIAPKREEMGGEKQVEKRVVAQLLALLDGLESRGQIIVIGATNIPNAIDPALRRPGRFDREISIPIPDKNGRLEILEIHTRGMPLAKDVVLEKLAEITHGYVGADLEALARESAMTCLRKILPEVDFELDEIPYETLMKLEVKMDDFLTAMRDIEPSAIREVFVEVPLVKWSDIGGLDSVKKTLVETVEWPLKYANLYAHSKIKPAKGILLSGPPGTGKTLLAKALANESGVNFISVKGPELFNKYVGESEKGVREVFRKAKQASPCIVFFDEVDSLVPQRGGGDSFVADRVIGQFLAEMDGIEEMKGVMILAATNRIDRVDSALLRPGRFDLTIELPMPDQKARLEIFKVHTKAKPLDKDVDLEKFAKDTEGKSGADIEAICREAGMNAIREFIKSGRKDIEKFRITKDDFKKHIINRKG